ncbi:thioredoxin family protein [Maribacter algarum]|uniref:DUF1223 domain-containing protein n=1 Tax=Maribacter algarum (ex Zhang et al. 2020) TaxID=2578118 RepID=UPI00148660B3|nr:DUF1223 domain-containing protein [Maribacter algarum]
MKNIYIVLIVLGSLVTMAFTIDINKKDRSNFELSEEAIYEPIVVLELFTSQGCSSCPSADLLLQKVKKEYKEKVFALSYHVDYWNYIGWKDPFSKSEFTKKQRAYNIKFRNRSNYTPQLVVNGKEHFVGSSSAKMYGRINDYGQKKATNKINLNGASVDKNKVSFKYQVQGSLKNKMIRTLLVLDERTTQVKRGENRNRTLQNSNIVVAEKSVVLEESASTIEISIPKLVKPNDNLNLIVLVETKEYDIKAAAKQSLVR